MNLIEQLISEAIEGRLQKANQPLLDELGLLRGQVNEHEHRWTLLIERLETLRTDAVEYWGEFGVPGTAADVLNDSIWIAVRTLNGLGCGAKDRPSKNPKPPTTATPEVTP